MLKVVRFVPFANVRVDPVAYVTVDVKSTFSPLFTTSDPPFTTVTPV